MLLVLGANSQEKRPTLKVSVGIRIKLYKLDRLGRRGSRMERKMNSKKKKSKLLSRVWISQVTDFSSVYGG